MRSSARDGTVVDMRSLLSSEPTNLLASIPGALATSAAPWTVQVLLAIAVVVVWPMFTIGVVGLMRRWGIPTSSRRSRSQQARLRTDRVPRRPAQSPGSATSASERPSYRPATDHHEGQQAA